MFSCFYTVFSCFRSHRFFAQFCMFQRNKSETKKKIFLPEPEYQEPACEAFLKVAIPILFKIKKDLLFKDSTVIFLLFYYSPV